jgi:hypothetical protein
VSTLWPTFLVWSMTDPMPSISTSNPSPKCTVPRTDVSSDVSASRHPVMWLFAPVLRTHESLSLSRSWRYTFSSLRCTTCCVPGCMLCSDCLAHTTFTVASRSAGCSTPLSAHGVTPPYDPSWDICNLASSDHICHSFGIDTSSLVCPLSSI